MAMFAVFSSGAEYEFHVGSEITRKFRINNIVEVQADGHELEWIRKNVSGIPMHSGRIVNWFGSDAQFVFYAARNWVRVK